ARRRYWRRQHCERIRLRRDEFRYRLVPDLARARVFFLAELRRLRMRLARSADIPVRSNELRKTRPRIGALAFGSRCGQECPRSANQIPGCGPCCYAAKASPHRAEWMARGGGSA